jgi:hypothetical protein
VGDLQSWLVQENGYRDLDWRKTDKGCWAYRGTKTLLKVSSERSDQWTEMHCPKIIRAKSMAQVVEHLGSLGSNPSTAPKKKKV